MNLFSCAQVMLGFSFMKYYTLTTLTWAETDWYDKREDILGFIFRLSTVGVSGRYPSVIEIISVAKGHLDH